MAKAIVCIPWRPTDERFAAYERVTSFWTHHGFSYIPADSDHAGEYLPADRLEPFNLSKARNRAVAAANSEYVIVADADTIPDIGAVMFALDNEFDGVTWPFRQYRHIPNSHALQADLMTAKPDRVYSGSVGGLFICRRELYWELGGCDELFTGWGFEDNAFHLVAQTLSHVRRIDGIVFSFNHFDGDPRDDSERDMTATNINRNRFALYQMCRNSKDLMRELIRRV